ncbi:MAG: hypothetical protein LKH29_02090 [Eggerthellaceae bacterium]|jgi:hypothetical protein|nr:hypothetical protein [Eggerthellaceae bacterium]
MDRNERRRLRLSIQRDMRAHLISPDEYFLYGFSSKSEAEKNEFVGDLERTILCARMYNSVPEGQIFMDKMRTYQYFSSFFKRDVIEIRTQEDFDVYTSFCEKHSQYIVKPPSSSRGSGIYLAFSGEGDQERRAAFEALLDEAPVVLEEVIDQAPEMARLHPESVNTIRYATFFEEGEISTLCCFVKIGRGSSVVDNGGAGGFLAAVDQETGVITTPGRTELGEVVEVHPDTGVAIVGYQIPQWDDLKSMVSELVRVLPQQKYVGWDLACSASKGWVLVEGNSGGQFVGPQISMGKGIRPLVQDTFGSL